MKKDYSIFFGKEWAQKLSPFLYTKEYNNIGKELVKLVESGVVVTPGFKNIFRAFKECPYHLLHTVIIGQDVYSNLTNNGDFVADGIAFSSNTSVNAPDVLNSILEAVDTTICDGEFYPKLGWSQDLRRPVWDLSYLSNQGILLLNCSLTATVGRSNEHLNLWKPFIEYVVKTITDDKDSLGIVLLGNYANNLRSVIKNDTHFIANCEHPSQAIFQKTSWKHNGVLKALHTFQKKKNNISIQW